MTCSTCKKVPLPLNAMAGKCTNCQTKTSSRAYKLCGACSKALAKCDRCLKPLKSSSGNSHNPSAWQVLYKHPDAKNLASARQAVNRATAKLKKENPGSYTVIAYSFGAFTVLAAEERTLSALPMQISKFERGAVEKTPERRLPPRPMPKRPR